MRIAPQDAPDGVAALTTASAYRSRRLTLRERLELFRLHPSSTNVSTTTAAPKKHQELLHHTPKPSIQTNLSYDKVRLGSLLGNGAYASVYDVSFSTSTRKLLPPVKKYKRQIMFRSYDVGNSTTDQKQSIQFEDSFIDEPVEEDESREEHEHESTPLLISTKKSSDECDGDNQEYSDDESGDRNSRYYALKCLNKERLQNSDFCTKEKLIKIASTDFLMEAKVLSKIALIRSSRDSGGHPNIIGLVGVSSGFYNDPCKGFLILEKVNETLSQALDRWAKTSSPPLLDSTNSMSGAGSERRLVVSSLIPRHQRQKRRLRHQQGERIRVAALGIARALEFLHEHNIIYRDIKPANVGFSQQDGQVRLLDFGLARQVHSNPARRKKLAGNCGTPRYMSPEVMLEQDYSFPADVHSYALLLWEILTLTRPYNNASTVVELRTWTIRDKQRPPLGQVASPDMKAVLKQSWTPNPEQRPCMKRIVKQLEFELEALDRSSSSEFSCNPRK